MRGLFLGFPSVSVSNTLMPLLSELASGGYKITYYNTKEFRPASCTGFDFIPYPDCFEEYVSDKMNSGISYFQFARILMDISEELMDFLLEEAGRKRPEFIIHSHLAAWGKMIAGFLKVPSVVAYSTFALDSRIMLPYFRRLASDKALEMENVREAVGFHKASTRLYTRLQLTEKPDPWDAYYNRGDLNLSFILEQFQPEKQVIATSFTFIGYPAPVIDNRVEKDIIYVSMGTVLNDDVTLFRICIDVLKNLSLPVILSVGYKVDIETLGDIPEHVEVVPFVDQFEVLKRAVLFVTRGGMASIHESIHTWTPMIVVPVIPEQQLTGGRVQELGIGINIPWKEFSADGFQQAVRDILKNRDNYVRNLKRVIDTVPELPPQKSALGLINSFLNRTVIDLFREQAQSIPLSIALRCGTRYLTFAELDRYTDQLAFRLLGYGIQKADLVPVVIGPGIDIVIAILGIMKAGAAYVPIDPQLPAERIQYMIEDISGRIVLSNEGSVQNLTRGSYDLLLMEDFWAWASMADGSQPPDAPEPADLAYVIYTSGSSGRPKGVMVEHRSILTYMLDVYDRLDLKECNSYAVLGTFSADAGLTAFFAAICFGKPLLLIDVKRFQGFEDLIHHFAAFPVDCYKITPSLMSLFLEQEHVGKILPYKRLILGGEACSIPLAAAVGNILPGECRLFNHYGPTETTVGITTYEFPRDMNKWPEMIPLGAPLRHVGVHVLDKDESPCGTGVIGELCVEGPLLAKGYLKDAELTRRKFTRIVVNGLEKRLYRTGDLVKILSNGVLEFHGRIDDQVKILGYRIEVKEVENAITMVGLVKQCVVMAREDRGGRKMLVGYIQTDAGFDRGRLLGALRQKLPAHMIPAKWVLMEQWPLTFNNKIDRKALPDPPDENDLEGGDSSYAADSVEFKLHEIWCRVFESRHISPENDFFELGGDSLLLMKLSFEIRNAWGVELSPGELFSCLTLKDQVSLISKKGKAEVPGPENREGFEADRPTPVQKKLYLRSRLNPKESYPNSSVTYFLSGEIEFSWLNNAFRAIIEKNDILRTAYIFENGQLYAKAVAGSSFEIEVAHSREPDVDQAIIFLTRPFDLSLSPSIRVYLIELADSTKYLHIDLPHINADGRSLTVIMDDLERIYSGQYQHVTRRQFTDFKKYQHEYLHSGRCRADEDFWRAQFLKGNLLFNRKLPDRISGPLAFDGVFHVIAFPEELFSRINDYVKRKRLTRFQILFCSYALLLSNITAAREFAVIIPVLNRNEPGLDDVIGLLSNMIPIVVRFPGEYSVQDFVDACRNSLLESMAHQSYPFENIRNLWTDSGKEAATLLTLYFGYQYGKSEYAFGDTSFTLHVPLKNRERLPFSCSINETERSLTMTLSSSVGSFSKSQLEAFSEKYLRILDFLISSDDSRPIGPLIGGMVDTASMTQ